MLGSSLTLRQMFYQPGARNKICLANWTKADVPNISSYVALNAMLRPLMRRKASLVCEAFAAHSTFKQRTWMTCIVAGSTLLFAYVPWIFCNIVIKYN